MVKEESAILKISQLRLSNVRNRKKIEEKSTEPRKPVGQHQLYNIQRVEVPEREEREKGGEKTSKKTMAQTFQVK